MSSSLPSGPAETILEGIVVAGDGRGRQLGFPTANVELASAAGLPDDGVYAGWVERADGSKYAAAISLGTRPTYYDKQGGRVLEAFLLDFEGDLYGERVRVGMGTLVRDQMRFEDGEQLVAQMRRDVEAVRAAGQGA